MNTGKWTALVSFLIIGITCIVLAFQRDSSARKVKELECVIAIYAQQPEFSSRKP